MKRPVPIGGPVDFTKDEVRQARAGNYKAAMKRLKKVATERNKQIKLFGGPHSSAEVKRLARKSD